MLGKSAEIMALNWDLHFQKQNWSRKDLKTRVENLVQWCWLEWQKACIIRSAAKQIRE